MKVISKRNIYTNTVEQVFRTKSEASKELNVSQQAIYNAIKFENNCKNYKFTEDIIEDKKIIEFLNNDNDK